MAKIKGYTWNIAIFALFAVLAFWRSTQLPNFGSSQIKTIIIGVLAIALLAMGQSIIIIGGGINLAIGAEAVLINCLTAKYMNGASFSKSILIALGAIALGILIGSLTGFIISKSGIADIVVTLATSFILVGLAMYVLPQPGGGANTSFAQLISGSGNSFLAPLLAFLIPFIFIWIPIYRSRPGIAIYAVGSNREAAFLSGVNVQNTRIFSYALGGFFAGFSGMVLTCITLGASPFANISSAATLNSVAASVLGGVALSGGVGGLFGPAIAALVIYFIPTIMLGYGIDSAYSQILQGALTILVVLLGEVLRRRAGRVK
jgi:ribose transport system permease protein